MSETVVEKALWVVRCIDDATNVSDGTLSCDDIKAVAVAYLSEHADHDEPLAADWLASQEWEWLGHAREWHWRPPSVSSVQIGQTRGGAFYWCVDGMHALRLRTRGDVRWILARSQDYFEGRVSPEATDPESS